MDLKQLEHIHGIHVRSRRFGTYSRNTIFDRHKKNTNPGSDKIMAICRALEITPEQLLTGEEIDDVTEFKPITEQAYAEKTFMGLTTFSEELPVTKVTIVQS